MPTQTREKPASINARMRAMFLRYPMTPMTAGEIRDALYLPRDTAITARIREIRNAKRAPMDIRCQRVTFPDGGGVGYVYAFWPANTVLPGPGEDIPY